MFCNLTLARTGSFRTFFRFAGLSGLGWLLDFALLLTFVGVTGMKGFTANLASSLIAASTVFLISRRLVFLQRTGRWLPRLSGYLLYTVAVVLVASVAFDHLVSLLGQLAVRFDAGAPTVVLSALAKVIITPPQLLLNFAVSRVLNERAL